MNPAARLCRSRLSQAAWLGSLLVHAAVIVLLSLGMARSRGADPGELRVFDLSNITFYHPTPTVPRARPAPPATAPVAHPSVMQMPNPAARVQPHPAPRPSMPTVRHTPPPAPTPVAARPTTALDPTRPAAPSRPLRAFTPPRWRAPVPAPASVNGGGGGGGLNLGPAVAGGTIGDPGQGSARPGTPGAGVGSGTGSGSGSGSGSGHGSGSGEGVSHHSAPPPPPPPPLPPPPDPPRPAPTRLADRATPEVTSKVQPQYPQECQDEGVEGTVSLLVEVLDSGSVGKVKVARSSGDSRLDAAAVSAVRRWRYQPAVQGGIARTVTTHASITFALR